MERELLLIYLPKVCGGKSNCSRTTEQGRIRDNSSGAIPSVSCALLSDVLCDLPCGTFFDVLCGLLCSVLSGILCSLLCGVLPCAFLSVRGVPSGVLLGAFLGLSACCKLGVCFLFPLLASFRFLVFM